MVLCCNSRLLIAVFMLGGSLDVKVNLTIILWNCGDRTDQEPSAPARHMPGLKISRS